MFSVISSYSLLFLIAVDAQTLGIVCSVVMLTVHRELSPASELVAQVAETFGIVLRGCVRAFVDNLVATYSSFKCSSVTLSFYKVSEFLYLRLGWAIFVKHESNNWLFFRIRCVI